jgi:hypothetical protein
VRVVGILFVTVIRCAGKSKREVVVCVGSMKCDNESKQSANEGILRCSEWWKRGARFIVYEWNRRLVINAIKCLDATEHAQ